MINRFDIPITLACCALAALTLIVSRLYPPVAIISLIFLSLAVFSSSTSSRPGVSLAIIAATCTLILSFRFPYLSWADPWQDYESVMEILVQGSPAIEGYRLQQPILPTVVAVLSGFLHIPAISIQKIVIPLIGSAAVPIVYFIAREYMDRKTALTAALIFLSSTPYLHWASQGVRETVGIPFFLLSLFFAHRAIRTGTPSDLLIALISIVGLILAHHQSAFMFCLIFNALCIAEVLLFIPHSRGRAAVMRIALISGFAIAGMLIWWKTRIPFIYEALFNTTSNLHFAEYNSGLLLVACGYCIFLGIIILPTFSEPVGQWFRICLHRLGANSKELQVFLCGILIIIGFIVLSWHSTKLGIITNYPPHMIIGLMIPVILAIIGVSSFFTPERFPILIFAIVPGVLLIIGLTRIFPGVEVLWDSQIDPLRFLGYLWIPLSLIAASGFVKIFLTHSIWQGALICTFIFSIVAVFPSIVLIGNTFTPDHPLYDNRSLVVSHPGYEIQAISWFAGERTSGNLTSDRYAYSSARWLNTQGKTIKEPTDRPIIGENYGYWLITKRMDVYANFVEWITRIPRPLSQEERQRLDSTIRLYDNGGSEIYQYTPSR